MDNLPFALWVLLWPLSVIIHKWIRVKLLDGETYSEWTVFFSSLIDLATWIYVAWLLYK